MEIEISRYGCLSMLALLLAIIAAVIGYNVSPRVKGHPVLLTTENYAIKRYLDRAEGWAEVMAQEQTRLADVASHFSPSNQTPVPASHPEDIYSRARQARDARDRLERVRKEMERTEVPASLGGLHAMAVDAVEAQLGLAGTVLDSIGAPGVDPPGLAARRQRAEELLRDLQEALAAQRQAME